MALISLPVCSPALLLFARLKQRADLCERERERERELQRAFVSLVFVGVFLRRCCWRSAVPRDPPPPHHHLDQRMAALGCGCRHPPTPTPPPPGHTTGYKTFTKCEHTQSVCVCSSYSYSSSSRFRRSVRSARFDSSSERPSGYFGFNKCRRRSEEAPDRCPTFSSVDLQPGWLLKTLLLGSPSLPRCSSLSAVSGNERRREERMRSEAKRWNGGSYW